VEMVSMQSVLGGEVDFEAVSAAVAEQLAKVFA
jgi:hypothetical protein